MVAFRSVAGCASRFTVEVELSYSACSAAAYGRELMVAHHDLPLAPISQPRCVAAARSVR